LTKREKKRKTNKQTNKKKLRDGAEASIQPSNDAAHRSLATLKPRRVHGRGALSSRPRWPERVAFDQPAAELRTGLVGTCNEQTTDAPASAAPISRSTEPAAAPITRSGIPAPQLPKYVTRMLVAVASIFGARRTLLACPCLSGIGGVDSLRAASFPSDKRHDSFGLQPP
jgi:hypothetical protein